MEQSGINKFYMEKHNILPTTLYRENIGEQFANEFETLMKDEIVERGPNMPHHFSASRYVLSAPQYDKIRSYIEALITRYYREILDIDGFGMITQSWVNVNKPNEFTHRHVHPNSFVSGVLYLSVQGQNAGIMFHKPQHQSNNGTYTLQPKSTGKDAQSEMVSVKNGDLVIFPSFLMHSVPKNTTDTDRWSLAFNSLTKDTVGDYARLTEFRLNQ